jgi:hypothetical protein
MIPEAATASECSMVLIFFVAPPLGGVLLACVILVWCRGVEVSPTRQ